MIFVSHRHHVRRALTMSALLGGSLGRDRNAFANDPQSDHPLTAGPSVSPSLPLPVLRQNQASPALPMGLELKLRHH